MSPSMRLTCSWKGQLDRSLSRNEVSNKTIFDVKQKTWKELSNMKLSNLTIFPTALSNNMHALHGPQTIFQLKRLLGLTRCSIEYKKTKDETLFCDPWEKRTSEDRMIMIMIGLSLVLQVFYGMDLYILNCQEHIIRKLGKRG